MSNNRSNNRRRGRGNNRSQGGNQLNRIDSRARGNAPQMLEKYKKLAHDASLNGDRVQSEYYLQFADHYFRVVADTKASKDDARARREAERDQSDNFGDDDTQGERSQKRGRDRQDDTGEAQNAEQASNGDASDDSDSSETQSTRGARAKPRRTRRERQPESSNDDGDGGLDPSTLPPAIARDDDGEEEPKEEKPRRQRRPRTRSSDDDETLQAVN